MSSTSAAVPSPPSLRHSEVKTTAQATPSHSLGLTARIVLGYTVAAMVTLAVAGLVLYRGLRHTFEIEDAENLADHVRMLRREMSQRPDDLSAATEIIMDAADERRVEKCYGRLMDEQHRVLVETPGFSKFAPPDGVFPRAMRLQEDVTEVMGAKSRDGTPTFLVAARVGRGSLHPPLVYEVVMDATRVEGWLKDYRFEFGCMVAGGTLLSGLLAWGITRGALHPLHQITRKMQRVTASGMSERVGTRRWPQELAALAAEFDKMLERLRASFQRLSQFSADAAHEFRTPLNNLMMATSLTLARERTAEEYRHALAGNLDEFERLKRMMDSLLFLARADNAEAVLHKSALNAAAVVADVLDFFSAVAEESGVSLSCEGACRVSADETLLRVALTNLVSNALRHAPGGGQVTVRVHGEGAGSEIAVKNTGTCIPAAHLPRLFDRFYRADAARTGGGDSGVGLGLALVKAIMDLHHGTVVVTSDEREGTCFRLHFPPAEEA